MILSVLMRVTALAVWVLAGVMGRLAWLESTTPYGSRKVAVLAFIVGVLLIGGGLGLWKGARDAD